MARRRYDEAEPPRALDTKVDIVDAKVHSDQAGVTGVRDPRSDPAGLAITL